MAFCSKCGAQIADGVSFCPLCGASVGGIQVQAQAVPMQQQAAPLRQQSLAEVERMYEYFNRKKAQYDEYDAINDRLDVLARGTRKAALVWGIIVAAFSLIILLSGAASREGAAVVAGLIGMALGGGLITIYGTLVSKRKKEAANLCVRLDELSNELIAHYNAYGYCSVGAEYSNPAILAQMYEVIRAGRADSPKEAINIMLDDAHRTTMELQAALQTANTAAAARGAGVAAAFSAASFFLG